MKQIILSILIVLTATVVNAQPDVRCQAVNYEAANWKTWLLDNPQQITIVAPPAAARAKGEAGGVRDAGAVSD